MTSRSKSLLRQSSWRIVASLGFLYLVSSLHAQMGVAPSQTGIFFNDLRARMNQSKAGASQQQQSGQTGSEGTYDYRGGQFQGQPVQERELGVPPGGGAIGTDGSNLMGSGGSAPVSYSRRLAGDYTSYGGPYPSSATFFAPSYVSDPFLSGRRNVILGPVNLGLGLSASGEYNDNVTRAHTDRLADYIASIYTNVDANYQISEFNRLTLTAAVGVNHYFNHPEVSTRGKEFDVQVLPGTSLAFDVKAGDVTFVFYDRISVRPASADQFALDNRDVFGVFQNDAGVAANWAINSQLALSVNYSHSTANSLREVDKIYDRTIDSISMNLAWTPSGQTWTLGLEGSYAWTDYKESYNNDSRAGSVGLFFVYPFTKYTTMRAAVGVQHLVFDKPPAFNRTVTDATLVATENSITDLNNQIAAVPATDPDQATKVAALQKQLTQAQNELSQQQITKQKEDATYNSRTQDNNSDITDPYYNISIVNQLNSRITQNISAGHETSLNTQSNFITADYVTYGIGIIAWRGARVNLSGYYEKSKESGGRLKEDLNQFGFDVQLTHRLGDNLTLGLGYHYGNINSDVALRDYVQHALTADLAYALSTRWSVGLGYRYWKTNAEDPNQSFTQNRVILSTNYNF